MRSTLIAALSACAEKPLEVRTRRFLIGLSRDELQFIAEFLGICLLESGLPRAELSSRLANFLQAGTAQSGPPGDRDHKMILLREYMSHSGVQPFPAVRARHA